MKRTSTVAHVYMRSHEGAKVEHFDVSNMIYHKFSLGAISCTLNGENVNVMLELMIIILGLISAIKNMRFLTLSSIAVSSCLLDLNTL